MTSFDTQSSESLNETSHSEIRQFAIRLKIRFGNDAAVTAEHIMQEHEKMGDFARAKVWQNVASSIKLNDIIHPNLTIKVNVLH